MPRFLCFHTLPPKGMSIDQVRQFGQIVKKETTVKGRRSFGSLTEGKVACVFDAPTKQAVADFFKRNNMPVDNIVQVEFEGDAGEITQV